MNKKHSNKLVRIFLKVLGNFGISCFRDWLGTGKQKINYIYNVKTIEDALTSKIARAGSHSWVKKNSPWMW